MKKVVHEFSTEYILEGDEPTNICRVGQGDKCCAFVVVGPDGFECIRMSYPRNALIFSRLESGGMNAKGLGGWEGCPWHGSI